jgi:hypothetical protein
MVKPTNTDLVLTLDLDLDLDSNTKEPSVRVKHKQEVQIGTGVENGWIAELDEKLDEVRIEEIHPGRYGHQQQQHQPTSQQCSRSRSHSHSRPQSQPRSHKHRRQRSLSSLSSYSLPRTQSGSMTARQPVHGSQSRTQTHPTGLARARARSIDRSGSGGYVCSVLATWTAACGIGSGGGRPFSPGVPRGRGRTVGRHPTTLHLQHSEQVDLGKMEEEDKEGLSARVVVKEVDVDFNSEYVANSDSNLNAKLDLDLEINSIVPDRTVVFPSSSSRRRKESRGRELRSYSKLYEHLHPSGSGSPRSNSHPHSHSHSHSYSHSHSNAHSVTPCTPQPKLDPYTATLPTLIRALQTHTLTSVHIVETYLSQINAHNPTLRALCWVRDREAVLREASLCDQFRARGIVDWERTPLWGVPIVVK